MVFRGDGGFYPVVRYRLAVRPPTYIVLTEDGITEIFTIRGQIEWEAILYADDFYFRGQYWVRLLLDLIRRMKEADVPGRIELLNGCLLK